MNIVSGIILYRANFTIVTRQEDIVYIIRIHVYISINDDDPVTDIRFFSHGIYITKQRDSAGPGHQWR